MSTVLPDLYKIAENAAISSIDQAILRSFSRVHPANMGLRERSICCVRVYRYGRYGRRAPSAEPKRNEACEEVGRSTEEGRPMVGLLRVQTAMVLAFLSGTLAGCSAGGRSLPPTQPTAAAEGVLGALPRLPDGVSVPRRPSFIDTVPAQPPASNATRSPLAAHPSFFAGEVALSNGVYYLQLPNSNIFGYYAYIPQDTRYIYHFDLGYEYTIDANDGKGGIYLYDFASGHWWYTGALYPFPYLYDFTLNAFIYYYPDTTKPQHYTTSPRFFFNFGSGQIITIPSALPAPPVGYLGPASAGSLAGIMNNVSSGVTFVGISGVQFSGGPGVVVPTATVALSYGPTVLSSRRAPAAVAPRDDGRPHGLVDAPAEGPAELRALTAGLRTTSAPSGARRRPLSIPTTQGSTNAFWVAGGSLGAIGGSYTQRSATLQVVTAHGYIWIDNSLSLSGAVIQSIANDFENAYASDTAHYGTPNYTVSAPGLANRYFLTCDATGTLDAGSVPIWLTPTDNKIHVFVVDTVGLGSGVGGYFSSTNYRYQAALNCTIGKNGVTAQTVTRSNEVPMIYVGYNTKNPDYWETGEDLVRGTAHEFQHEINFVNHVILSDGPGEDPWINEGMSMLAQDFAVSRLYPGIPVDIDDAGWHAANYLTAPQNYSLTAFTGISSGSQAYNCTHCYGAEYLFQRYLYDRFGGDAYLQKMLGASTSYANVQQATGADPTQLISDFAIALAASGTGATSDPRFGFTGINLRATYNDQWGSPTTFAGPATQPLSSGSGPYMLGSFFYLSGDATASGKTISAKDVNGSFNLRAGVVQR
jgi:hypothetical protein